MSGGLTREINPWIKVENLNSDQLADDFPI